MMGFTDFFTPDLQGFLCALLSAVRGGGRDQGSPSSSQSTKRTSHSTENTQGWGCWSGVPDDLALDVGQWDYRTTEGSEKVLLRGGVASGQSWSPTGQPMQGGQRNGSCLSWN